MGQPLKVLIVEDSEEDVLLLIRSLQAGGYNPECTTIETARAMQDALVEKQWDIILCDYRLPLFNALKALALLKETNIDIPFIIVSGAIGEETAAECMRAGAHDYIRKGNLSRLVPAVKRELSEAASRLSRRRAEQAVIASEFKLQALFANMSNCAAVFEARNEGMDFLFLDFNRAAETTEKIDRELLLGKSLAETFPGIRETGLPEVMQRVWQTGEAEQLPARYYRDERISGWREYYVYKLPGGEIVVLYTDITGRKQAEKKIFESEEKYRLLVENTSEAIFIIQDRALKFVNRATMEIFGASYEVLLATDFTEFIHPEDRELVISSHLRKLSGEQVPPVYAFRIVTPAGILKWVEIHSTVIPWQGKPASLNFLNNITARKRLEEDIRRSEERFRNVIDAAGVYVYELDTHANITFVSDRVRNILGYEPAELIGQNISAVVYSPEEFARIRRIYVEQKIPVRNMDHRCRTKDGRERVLSITALPFFDAQGNPKGYQGVAQDITETRQAGEKLRNISAIQNLILENSSLGIAFVRNRVFDWVNNRLGELLLLPVDQIQGHSTEVIYPSYEAYETIGRECYLIIHNGERADNVCQLKRSDGTLFWCRFIGKALNPAQPAEGSIWMFEDITERKQAEEELRQSEGKYRAIFENSIEGIFQSSPAGQYLSVNPAFARMFGYASPAELIAQVTDISSQIYLHDTARQMFKTAMGENGYVAGFEIEARRKDGSSFWMSINAHTVRDGKGEILYFEGTCMDITGRKEAEEKIKYISAIQNLILDGSTLGIALVRNRVIKWANKRLGELVLLPLEKIQGQSTRIFYGNDEAYAELGRLAYPALLRGERSDNVLQIRRADGQFFWCRFIGKLLDPANPDGESLWMLEDITERKVAEEALQESEELFRKLFENHSAVKLLIDADSGNIIDANRAAEDFYGWRKAVLKKMKIQDINTLPPEKIREEIERVRQQKRVHFEFRHRRADGSIRDVEVFSSNIEMKGQNLLHSVIHDITERRRLEDDLSTSEKNYRSLAENMNDFLCVLDARSLKFRYVSPIAEHYLLYTSKELLELNPEQLYTPEAWKRTLDCLFGAAAARAAGQPAAAKPFEVEVIRKDGRHVWFEASYSLNYSQSGEFVSAQSVNRDITERKRLEEEVRQSEKKYRNIFENAVEGIFQNTIDGHFMSVNPAFARICGFSSPQEMINEISDIQNQLYLHQEDRTKMLALLGRQDVLNNYETQFRHRNGSIIWISMNVIAIRNKSGNIELIEGTITDITERKKTQAELEKTNLELNRAYEELRQKQSMIIQQEKMASIGMLAAGIAHEIKNPLAIVMQGTNYLQTTVKDDELLREVVERMNKAIVRADIIVKGLLSYARQSQLSLSRQNIPALIDEALALTEHEFRKKNLQLIKQYAPDLPPVPVDCNQIKQVFVNLLVNGADAMPPGGTFTIHTRQILYDNRQKLLEISFQDTGHGIPADKIANIFDPFYTTKTVGNTGLGLSISKGIIDNHGGIIYAESQAGQGAKFIIHLPVK